MEHRHGNRIATSFPIHIEMASCTLPGRIVDVSLSGAFVEVGVRIPEHTQVTVVSAAYKSARNKNPDRWRISAHVARRSINGVGLEWDQFAPVPILDLMRKDDVRQRKAKAVEKQVERPTPLLAMGAVPEFPAGNVASS